MTELSEGLRGVVARLESRDDHTPATLADALRGPLTIDDVAPFIKFDSTNYMRNLVTSNGSKWELRLLCWRPRQSSSLHGHGHAACAFRVIRGSAREAILGERDRTWAPGDLVEEVRSDLVHQVGNAGDDALLTLHAYSPPLPVDAPSPRAGRNIVIVGGGFSGVACAIHLLRDARDDLRITVVERGPWLGRGVAYGVDSSVFRLNVPASKMSVDPSDPSDFVRWAGVEATPHAFLSRARYGAYVVQRFGEALRASDGKLRVIRGDVEAVSDESVTLTDGSIIRADAVVLATGLAPRITPSMLPADPRIIDAWDECSLAALPRDGKILVLGSGLTAIDVIGFLSMHRFRGSVSIVSRRGLLPRPHVAHGAVTPLSADAIAHAPRELGALLRWGRSVVADAVGRGAPWQHGIDSLRPHVASLWRGLSPDDRRRFVRSIRPYWDVIRHRAPEDVHDLIETWRAAGRLDQFANSIATCAPAIDGLDVTFRNGRRERYDVIVRCIGPALERSDSDAPLVRALVDAQIALPDPAGLGIITDADGRVVGPRGPSSRLFALGALRRASSWETTAVPDIAAHAHALARHLS